MIYIVTDSSAGYSAAELSSRNVTMVGLHYSVSGINYTEGAREIGTDYCMAFSGKLTKTSQPSPDSFAQVFSELTQRGSVLCITLSSGLSGTYSAACLAARDFNNVKVVDSCTTSGGMHLLIDEAVNMVVGGMQLDEIVTGLDQIKSKISTIFTVETLEPLRRGGRLVINQAPSTTLNSRPILQCFGGINFITNVRGAKSRADALVDAIPLSVRRIFVLKCGVNTVTTQLVALLSAKFKNIKIHERTISPVLTIHIGEGAYGVSYISK